jgi:hypothetical protein
VAPRKKLLLLKHLLLLLQLKPLLLLLTLLLPHQLLLKPLLLLLTLLLLLPSNPYLQATKKPTQVGFFVLRPGFIQTISRQSRPSVWVAISIQSA